MSLRKGFLINQVSMQRHLYHMVELLVGLIQGELPVAVHLMLAGPSPLLHVLDIGVHHATQRIQYQT